MLRKFWCAECLLEIIAGAGSRERKWTVSSGVQSPINLSWLSVASWRAVDHHCLVHWEQKVTGLSSPLIPIQSLDVDCLGTASCWVIGALWNQSKTWRNWQLEKLCYLHLEQLRKCILLEYGFGWSISNFYSSYLSSTTKYLWTPK